ncbi:hypothetical protein J31TS4_22220 [Paenibacillus sp. J31TS4]|uniref:DoxX family protein n=1 Tax=Paenibacillus sp. J31TS4 TaxID=2807195 RepID=UPI001B19F393|nr:DoxX family protein [Paenibacillus sp. J31TS4]GIP38942.1 hypothetical protein J31TS4_22220 [Paenibacillus sp. J31TS4]
MHQLLMVLQSLLALGFMLSGLSKLAAEPAAEGAVLVRSRHRYAAGLAELAGAVGLIAGIWNPTVAVLAGLWLGATTSLVLWGSVLRLRQPLVRAALPAVLLALSLIVSVFHWTTAA